MDHKTKRISRNRIIEIAKIFRCAFKKYISKDGLYVDVIGITEVLPSVCENITIEIVEDKSLKEVPATCQPDYNGNYLIKIKESVYDGACEDIGGYRMHIMHEISHALLCMLGYTPICERSFKNRELRACESMEWQAKALAGEILIDKDLTSNMTIDEIVEKCAVSYESAQNRKTRK